jgi:hypothetical protein
MIIIPLILISALSPRFEYGLADINKPIVPLVTLMMASGALYLWVILRGKGVNLSKGLLAWVFILGLLARLVMFPSTPVLEDDHYRYLWDGGVLANGFNPYQYSPREVVGEEIDKVPEALRQLAREADPIPKRINYPWLRTIYPPLSQFVFALAHIIKPWSLSAWRLVLLLVDLATLYLLFTILRGLNLSLMGLVVYWWNPLLIKEIYNSGHMDVLIFPFVLGSLLLAIQKRHILASGALGLAVGVKLWPAILLPVMLRPLLGEPKKLLPPVLLFGVISITMLLPFFLTGLDADSGFTAYGRYWEMNDSLFMLLLWVVQFASKGLALEAGYAQLVTRILALGILFTWCGWLLRKNDRDSIEMSRRCLFVIAALFLLSPTQFPWYTLWILPFLAIHDRTSLLILTLLLPLYYMRFYFKARDMVHIHDYGIVWLEFAPVWFLLIWEWYKERKQHATLRKEAI